MVEVLRDSWTQLTDRLAPTNSKVAVAATRILDRAKRPPVSGGDHDVPRDDEGQDHESPTGVTTCCPLTRRSTLPRASRQLRATGDVSPRRSHIPVHRARTRPARVDPANLSGAVCPRCEPSRHRESAPFTGGYTATGSARRAPPSARTQRVQEAEEAGMSLGAVALWG